MQLDEVGFRYRRRAPWVLRDVNVSLPSGRIVEVVGRNGAGKSTLLKVLAGVLRPVRGRVAGRPSRIGYAPERFPVDQPFTARAYLTHMARIRGVPPAAGLPWAERLNYASLLDTRLAELSKGTAQKVGLTQALLASPELLVLDEPFAGLDAATRSALPSMLGELARAGTTVVVSDHQGDLGGRPEVSRWHVADQTVSASGRAEGAPEMTVLEVAVPAYEAEAVAERLRSEGYDVR